MFDTEKLNIFPQKPGVYLMKNRQGTVLYVGKAKNLRQRVKQYFVTSGDGRFMVPFLVSHVESIDTIVVTSEKEALLLENNLIKEHLPKYNALLKDDKTYIALKVTKHVWPRIDLVRYRGKPKSDGQYFGPYTNAGAARKTLDLLQRIFPMRQCSDAEFARRTRPCILYDMKRCIAPCVGLCTKDEYDGLVKKAVRFLKGQDREIVSELYAEMHRYSEALEFEKAGAVWSTINQIEKTIEGQLVDKPLGEDSDVIGIFREGDEVMVSLMFFRGGRLSGARHYNFVKIAEDDEELLETFLVQHYNQMEVLPHEILLPVSIESGAVLEELFSTGRQRKVAIYMPQRGSKKALLQMAFANAEAEFRKAKDVESIRERMLLELQEKFHLTHYPRRIECFDISNISGRDSVSCLVAFTDGVKDSSRYRKFKIKTVDSIDDYASMNEVLTRRFKRGKEDNDLPDLLIVDGGKGHLNVALKVLKELNIITVDVISVAKEEGRHDKGMTSEQVFLPGVKDPIFLRNTSPILFLLQQIRDEAHRTSISFHRNTRSKNTLKSELDEIRGVGPVKKKNLLRHFGSLKKIKEAAVEELAKAPGITLKDASTIKKFFTSDFT